MALADIGAILRVPGQLCINPTDLTLAFPHGGTALGLVKDIVVKPMESSQLIREESFGEEVIDVLHTGQGWILACALRAFDSDAISTVFPATSVGNVSGKVGISYPGTTFRAGTLRSSSAVKLVFSPLDPYRHKFIYFPVAIPLVDESAEFHLKVNDEELLGAIFYATRDATGRVVVIHRQEDMVL